MDISIKKKVIEKLAQLGDEKSIAALEKEAEKIASALASETNYNTLEGNAELLDSFAALTMTARKQSPCAEKPHMLEMMRLRTTG